MLEGTNWIGQTYTSDLGRDVLYDLAEIGPRLAASEGERAGHDRVLEAFETIGLRNVTREPFAVTKWERDSAGIDTTTPTDSAFEAIALPGSPGDVITGEIVHLGYGLPEDFDSEDLAGKIVVARSDVPKYYDRWMHRREKYFLAHDAGAAAFVYHNHVPGCLPPTGSLGGAKDVMGPLPAIGVSKEVGDRLALYCKETEGTVEGTVTVDVSVSEGESRNVVGEVGPDTDERVIVGAHVDGHDISEGALDNASGVAVLCEVARALSEHESELQRRVQFVGFGAEEMGLVGSQEFVTAHDLDTITAVVNCDGAGRARDLVAKTCGFEGMADAVEHVAGSLRHPYRHVPGVNTHSDHWPFVSHGVPGVQLQSDTGDGRGFGHTYADTFDKTDVRAIRDHAILATLLTSQLANTDRLARRTPESIAAELREKGLQEPMEIAGDWPF